MKENQTPVFYAARSDATNSMKGLIKRGCQYKLIRDYKARTPIHVAAELGELLLLLLLTYHRRLMMISEALRLRVEGGRVSHSWCMGVDGDGCGELGGGMDGDGGWYACGRIPGGWSHVGRSRSTSRVSCDTLMTPDHTAFQVRSSGYGRAGVGPSSWEGLNTGRHEKALFGGLRSRLAVGVWYFTDAGVVASSLAVMHARAIMVTVNYYSINYHDKGMILVLSF